jgi:clan AA aspartic protease (TIGR02281 family)
VRPLLLGVAVAGVVAGWQLRGLAVDGGVTPEVATALSQKQPLPEPILRLPTQKAVAAAAVSPTESSPSVDTVPSLEALYAALASADVSREGAIRGQLQEYISQRTAQLTSQQRWTELLGFYQRLVNLDPHVAEYYFRLAEVQVQLQLYDQALYSLYFILQDRVMGAKAQALEQRINRRLQFSEGITVPLLKYGSHHVVEARLPSGGLRLLLDTGASITTLTPEAARRLNLSYDLNRSISLATAGGLVAAPIIEVSDFSVGAAQVKRLQVGILPLLGDDGFDGLLGMNFLQQFASSINQQDGILHLQDKSEDLSG